MRTRAMDELKHGLEWSRHKVGDLRENLPWTCARKERSALAVVLGATLVLAVIVGVAMWVSRRLAEEDEGLTETRGDGLEAAATES